MSRAADRRREQQEMLDPEKGNQRPNIPPRPIDEANRCPGRVGGEHNFSQIHRDDPPGSGLTTVRCWYCNRMSPLSAARVAAWRNESRR